MTDTITAVDALGVLDMITIRARATARVHYRQYLWWMTAAHTEEERQANVSGLSAEIVREWRDRAMNDRTRAADAAWILTGRL